MTRRLYRLAGEVGDLAASPSDQHDPGRQIVGMRRAPGPEVDVDEASLRGFQHRPQRGSARQLHHVHATFAPCLEEAANHGLRDDLDELLVCFRYKTLEERKAVRTTNATERRFREVRRRTRPMGVFSDRTSMDRILFAVFTHENSTQGVPTLFSPTQNI